MLYVVLQLVIENGCGFDMLLVCQQAIVWQDDDYFHERSKTSATIIILYELIY